MKANEFELNTMGECTQVNICQLTTSRRVQQTNLDPASINKELIYQLVRAVLF